MTGMLERLDEPWAELHRELVGHLSRTQLQRLSLLLEQARESVHDDQP